MKDKTGIFRIIPILLIFLFMFGGCATVGEKFLELTQDQLSMTRNFTDGAENWLRMWPTYDGIIRRYLGKDIDWILPSRARAAMDELTEMAVRCTNGCDFTDWTPKLDMDYPYTAGTHRQFALGYTVGCYAVMCSEVVLVALEKIAPKLLEYIPPLVL